MFKMQMPQTLWIVIANEALHRMVYRAKWSNLTSLPRRLAPRNDLFSALLWFVSDFDIRIFYLKEGGG